MQNLWNHDNHLGGYSQNFLRKFVKISVTLGLISWVFKTKSPFLKQISLEVDIPYTISKNTCFWCEISSKIQVKVTKILRICVKKFCEYGTLSLLFYECVTKIRNCMDRKKVDKKEEIDELCMDDLNSRDVTPQKTIAEDLWKFEINKKNWTRKTKNQMCNKYFSAKCVTV